MVGLCWFIVAKPTKLDDFGGRNPLLGGFGDIPTCRIGRCELEIDLF